MTARPNSLPNTGPKKTVCVVVPDIVAQPGGVAALADFVIDTLRRSGRYEPIVVSVAVSSKDEASVRLRSPGSWGKRIRILNQARRGETHQHVGCHFAAA